MGWLSDALNSGAWGAAPAGPPVSSGGSISVPTQPWTLDQLGATAGANYLLKDPAKLAAAQADTLAAQNQLLTKLPTSGWTIDSPETRANWQNTYANGEGGNAAGDASNALYGTPERPAYDENARPGYAYGPGNMMYRAKFDKAGNIIPGSLDGGSLDDNQFGAAALIAAAIMTGGVAAAGEAGAAAGSASGAAGGVGGGLSSADLAALYGNAGYGAGMTGAETAAFDAGVGGLGGLPAAGYSNEGLHYGAGGLNAATSSPINSSLGFNWSGLGSNLQTAGRALNLAGQLGGTGQQQQAGSVSPSLGMRSPHATPEAVTPPSAQTLVLQQPQGQSIQLPNLAGAQDAVLNDIRQWMARTSGISAGGRK